MQEMPWATANVTTTTADPSALPTETTTATQPETVVITMGQAGGLMPAWQLTWTDGTTVGATVGWPTASTGGHGTSWQMDGLENATPSRGWRWKQDPGTLWGHPKANDDNYQWKTCCIVTHCNNHASHRWETDVRCISYFVDVTLCRAAFMSLNSYMQMAANRFKKKKCKN